MNRKHIAMFGLCVLSLSLATTPVTAFADVNSDTNSSNSSSTTDSNGTNNSDTPASSTAPDYGSQFITKAYIASNDDNSLKQIDSSEIHQKVQAVWNFDIRDTKQIKPGDTMTVQLPSQLKLSVSTDVPLIVNVNNAPVEVGTVTTNTTNNTVKVTFNDNIKNNAGELTGSFNATVQWDLNQVQNLQNISLDWALDSQATINTETNIALTDDTIGKADPILDQNGDFRQKANGDIQVQWSILVNVGQSDRGNKLNITSNVDSNMANAWAKDDTIVWTVKGLDSGTTPTPDKQVDRSNYNVNVDDTGRITVDLSNLDHNTAYEVQVFQNLNKNSFRRVFKNKTSIESDNLKHAPIGGSTNILNVDAHGTLLAAIPINPPKPSNPTDTPPETIQLTNISGKINWQDEGNADKRPKNVSVALLANGHETGDFVDVNLATGLFEFTDLVANNSDGTPIKYSVKEVPTPPGYTVTGGDGANGNYDITNTYNPQPEPKPEPEPTPEPKPEPEPTNSSTDTSSTTPTTPVAPDPVDPSNTDSSTTPVIAPPTEPILPPDDTSSADEPTPIAPDPVDPSDSSTSSSTAIAGPDTPSTPTNTDSKVPTPVAPDPVHPQPVTPHQADPQPVAPKPTASTPATPKAPQPVKPTAPTKAPVVNQKKVKFNPMNYVKKPEGKTLPRTDQTSDTLMLATGVGLIIIKFAQFLKLQKRKD